MRSSYDAIVIGFGPAASSAAQRLATSGRSVAMIDRKPAGPASDWIDHWLVPWQADASLAATGWNCAALESLALQSVEVEDAGSGETARCALIDIEDFRERAMTGARESGVETLASVFADYLFAGARTSGVRTTHGSLTAPLVLCAQPTSACDVAVWGRYRGVWRESGLRGATAAQFHGRDGARFWMLPLDDEQTELGVAVCASAPHVSAPHVSSAAQLWEDELVNCPALAERMMDATMVESYPLQTYRRREAIFPPGVVAIEELECAAATAFRWSVLAGALRTADGMMRGLGAPASAS